MEEEEHMAEDKEVAGKSWAWAWIRYHAKRRPRIHTYTITLKVPVELVEQIHKCMQKEGITSRSDWIRKAIKFYMEVHGCGL